MRLSELRPALTYLPIGALIALISTGSVRSHPNDLASAPVSATAPAPAPALIDTTPLDENGLRKRIARVIVEDFQIRAVTPLVGGYSRIDIETGNGAGHLFMAPDQRFFIAGNLVDSEAPKRSNKQPSPPPQQGVQSPAKTVEASVASPSSSIFTAVAGRPAVIQGNGANDLYVFFDPLCHVCHQFYQRLANGLAAKHRLKVHWLPVVVLEGAESHKRAQFIADALLNNDQKVAATVLDATMNNRDSRIPANWVSNESALAMVRENTELLLDAINGIEGAGTPTVVFKSKSGKTRVIGWLPDEADLAEIAN